MEGCEANITEAPTLRFLDFKDPWTSGILLDKIKKVYSGKTKPKEIGCFPVFGSTKEIGRCSRYTHDEESLLIARVGANAGTIYRVSGKYSVTDNTLILLAKDSESLAFIAYFLKFFNLKRLVFGTGQPLITGGLLKKIATTFPSLPEQTKIAHFLSAIDTRIHQLTEKKALLEEYKKGVMQQLFSQTIRFKDDDGNDFPDWEEKRLGDIGTTYSGLTGKSGSDFGNGELYVTYKQIFDHSIVDLQKCCHVKIKPNERQNKVKRGDILFTTSSETRLEVGFTSVMMEETDALYLNSFCFGFRRNSDTDLLPNFARYFFHSNKVRRKITVLGQGSTRYNISKIQLMKNSFMFPSVLEQTKIANFLSALDCKIQSITFQITETKTYKKGLLQQMFV